MPLGEFLPAQAPEKTYPICFLCRLKQEGRIRSAGGRGGVRVCSDHAAIEKN